MKKQMISIIIAIFVLTTPLLLMWSHSYVSHGKIINMNPVAYIKDMNNYMTQGEIPQNLNGKILIFYKYGCIDCRDVKDVLKRYSDVNDDIIYVSSQSEKGKQLIEEYDIQHVPTAVYIDGDNITKQILLYENYEELLTDLIMNQQRY